MNNPLWMYQYDSHALAAVFAVNIELQLQFKN